MEPSGGSEEAASRRRGVRCPMPPQHMPASERTPPATEPEAISSTCWSGVRERWRSLRRSSSASPIFLARKRRSWASSPRSRPRRRLRCAPRRPGSSPASFSTGPSSISSPRHRENRFRPEHRRFRAVGATEIRVAVDPQEQETLWELRHAASPTIAKLDPNLKSMQFIEDGCVPPARLPDYVKGIRRALDRQMIRGVIFGHAGDAHIHVNPLVDVRMTDWRRRVTVLLDEATDLVASLGGTISGEHGDGRIRTPLLERVWPAESLAAFERVKTEYDSSGLLNPGVKVRGIPGIGEIKYDPALPAVPPEARKVLDEVERRRAYGEFRLDMLRR